MFFCTPVKHEMQAASARLESKRRKLAQKRCNHNYFLREVDRQQQNVQRALNSLETARLALPTSKIQYDTVKSEYEEKIKEYTRKRNKKKPRVVDATANIAFSDLSHKRILEGEKRYEHERELRYSNGVLVVPREEHMRYRWPSPRDSWSFRSICQDGFDFYSIQEKEITLGFFDAVLSRVLGNATDRDVQTIIMEYSPFATLDFSLVGNNGRSHVLPIAIHFNYKFDYPHKIAILSPNGPHIMRAYNMYSRPADRDEKIIEGFKIYNPSQTWCLARDVNEWTKKKNLDISIVFQVPRLMV